MRDSGHFSHSRRLTDPPSVRSMRALLVVGVVLTACALIGASFLWDYGGQCLPSNALPPGTVQIQPDGKMISDDDCRQHEIVFGSEIAAILVAGAIVCVWLYRSRTYTVVAERATEVAGRVKAVAEVATGSDVAWRWWLGVVALSVFAAVYSNIRLASMPARVAAQPATGSESAVALFLTSTAVYWFFYFMARMRVEDRRQITPFWRRTPWSTASTLVFSLIIFSVVAVPATLIREHFSSPPQYYASVLGFVPWLAWSVLSGKLRFR